MNDPDFGQVHAAPGNGGENAEWAARYREWLAAVSEGFCPECGSRLTDRGYCWGSGTPADVSHGPGFNIIRMPGRHHRPVAWHLCQKSDQAAEGWPAVCTAFLDVLHHVRPCHWCGWTP